MLCAITSIFQRWNKDISRKEEEEKKEEEEEEMEKNWLSFPYN